ncbi:MAG: hypothetical protein K1X89_01805 [Myxococcaceae bacterium]|nr:hypothetical protein [Myxococcaceae bacterium]
MHRPKQSAPLGALSPFVIAARTEHLAPACDLLFVSPIDLTWEEKHFGLFVIDAPFDEKLPERLQVAAGVGDFEFKRQLNSYWPHLRELLVGVIAKVTKEAKDGPAPERIASFMGAVIHKSIENNQRLTDKFLPIIANAVPLVVSWAGARLALAAIEHRARQLNATGMTRERYSAMVQALRELRLVQALLRVALPASSPFPELSLGSVSGHSATVAGVGVSSIEMLRLSPSIAANRLGQDKALSMFIAEFVNNGSIGGDAAYACARYGEMSDPDLDAVVPEVAVGFEVKLVQASSAKTGENLKPICHDLKKQLPEYFARGCTEVFFVTNVVEALAKQMVEVVKQEEPSLRDKTIRVIAGDPEHLYEELEAIVTKVNDARGDSLVKEASALFAPPEPSTAPPPAPVSESRSSSEPSSSSAAGNGATATVHTPPSA